MDNNQAIIQKIINSEGFKKGQSILYGKTEQEKIEICKMYCKQMGADFNKLNSYVEGLLGVR